MSSSDKKNKEVTEIQQFTYFCRFNLINYSYSLKCTCIHGCQTLAANFRAHIISVTCSLFKAQ